MFSATTKQIIDHTMLSELSGVISFPPIYKWKLFRGGSYGMSYQYYNIFWKIVDLIYLLNPNLWGVKKRGYLVSWINFSYIFIFQGIPNRYWKMSLKINISNIKFIINSLYYENIFWLISYSNWIWLVESYMIYIIWSYKAVWSAI